MDEKMKELLEKAKLTAGLAADSAVKAAGIVSQKGNQLVEKTKRSAKIFDLNNEVELLMRDIGRMVYLTHTGAETDEAALEEKLAQIDEKYAAIAAPLKKISPHKLRSTYGTMLYNKTGDIYIVADMLGHKDVNTTRKHYAEIEKDRKRYAAEVIKLKNTDPTADNED